MEEVKLQITYYNSFSKQTSVERFSEVKCLMIRFKEIINNSNIELLDFHSNENDRWYVAVKYI